MDDKRSFFESVYAAKNAEAHEIETGLFLGSAAAASDRRAMLKRRVSHVLICHPSLSEQHAVFKYKRVALMDEPHTNLLEYLPDALEFLFKARQSGGAVFVHCAKGISRSASVVIAWLMLGRGLGFDEAFSLCEEKHPIAYPNVGFQQQLRHLELLLPRDGSLEARLRQLRTVVPKGSFEDSHTLRIHDLISESMYDAIKEVEGIAEAILTKPALLQKREQWKRHGLYFENLHKYRARTGDDALIDRVRTAVENLQRLPKVFSESLKGVQLALAVAKEMTQWVSVAEAMRRPQPVDPDRGLTDRKRSASKSPSCEEEDAKKKDKKKDKNARRMEKLQRKVAKIEEAAKKAEGVAESSLVAAERAASVLLGTEDLESKFEGE